MVLNGSFKYLKSYEFTCFFYDFKTCTDIKTIQLYMKQIQYTIVPAIQTNQDDEHRSVYPFLWPQEWQKY